MRKDLLFEFRERFIERYEAVDVIEILGITMEDMWDSFADRIVDSSEITEELGIGELEDDIDNERPD